jgi:hypothetical protein
VGIKNSFSLIGNPNIARVDVIATLQRIAHFLTGHSDIALMPEGGDYWSLGPVDDQWARYNEATRTFTIELRSDPGELRLWIYKQALIGVLGLEDFNPALEDDLVECLAAPEEAE